MVKSAMHSVLKFYLNQIYELMKLYNKWIYEIFVLSRNESVHITSR